MLDRIMPIFAVIGLLSSAAYLGMAAWMIYDNFVHSKKKDATGKHVSA
ncbi:hypothetical protein [Neisseria chenwenguii]|nr:hypothetical protein [Neisseria chenwenguii]